MYSVKVKYDDFFSFVDAMGVGHTVVVGYLPSEFWAYHHPTTIQYLPSKWGFCFHNKKGGEESSYQLFDTQEECEAKAKEYEERVVAPLNKALEEAKCTR